MLKPVQEHIEAKLFSYDKLRVHCDKSINSVGDLYVELRSGALGSADADKTTSAPSA